MTKRKKKKKRIQVKKGIQIEKPIIQKTFPRWWEVVFLPLALIYLELVLKGSVGGNFGVSLVGIVLFSFGYGLFLWLLTSLWKKEKCNRIIRIVVLCVISIWFIVNYFIYHAFKLFYDLNTVFAGGQDAATGFAGQIVDMVVSWSGVMHIALFSVPVILLIGFGKYFNRGFRGSLLERRFVIGGIVESLIISLLCIDGSGNWHGLTSAYSYQNAIDQYGLVTSFILDCIHQSKEDTSFEIEQEVVEEEPEEIIPEVVYEDQVLDIDFAQLATQDTGVFQQLDQYVASLTPTKENAWTGLLKGKNLIFISAEAFSGYVIDPILTPTLYRLANQGIRFTDYYQPASAGTTGGEYENLFGMLPTNGGSSFKMTSQDNNYITIGNGLNRQGYEGWAFHPNDYTYYSRHLTHNNLGYSHGFMGYGNGMEQFVTKQWPQSDYEMIQGTLDLYIDHEPFDIYYMSVSGHNPYSTGGNQMSKKNYDRVKDLDYSEEVKGYIAANLELEDGLTYLVEKLEEKGIADDTVIVIGADHFPYGLGGDDVFSTSNTLAELYGHPIRNYLERDQNRLIIWSGCLETMDPLEVDTPVSSLDILPTLSNLFDVDWDSRLLPGRDVFSDASPLVFNMLYDWKTDKGTYIAMQGQFYPAENVEIPDGYVDMINTIVKNKIQYCDGVSDSHYLSHLFQ